MKKQHLVTIRSNRRVYTFMVTGVTGADGKTRIPRKTLEEAITRADGRRGHAILIG